MASVGGISSKPGHKTCLLGPHGLEDMREPGSTGLRIERKGVVGIGLPLPGAGYHFASGSWRRVSLS